MNTPLLSELLIPTEIETLEEFNTRLMSLTTAINTATAAIVPCTKPSLHQEMVDQGTLSSTFNDEMGSKTPQEGTPPLPPQYLSMS